MLGISFSWGKVKPYLLVGIGVFLVILVGLALFFFLAYPSIQAQNLLAKAGILVLSAVDAETTSPTVAIQKYQTAISLLDDLLERYTNTNVVKKLIVGENRVGPMTLQELRTEAIPRAKLKFAIQSYSKAVEAEQRSFVDALTLYQETAALINEIQKDYPASQENTALLSGQTSIGSVDDIENKKIPLLKILAQCEVDPLKCSEFLVQKCTNPEVLINLSRTLVEAGRTESAANLLQIALKNVESSNYPEADSQIANIAAVYQKAGYSELAKTLFQDALNRLSFNPDSLEMAEVSYALSDCGKFDEAIALARAIPDEHKNWAYQHIAEQMAKNGRQKEALQLASSIEDPFYFALTIKTILETQADGDIVEEIMNEAESVQESYSKAGVLAALAKYLGKTNQPQKAKSLLIRAEELLKPAEIKSDSELSGYEWRRMFFYRPMFLQDICVGYILIGEESKAKEIIPQIAEDIEYCSQSITLAEISEVFLTKGDLKKAEEYAREIKHLFVKISALINLSKGFASHGDKDRAFSLLEEVFNLVKTTGIDEPFETFGFVNDLAIAYAEEGDFQKAFETASLISEKGSTFNAANALAKIGLSMERQGIQLGEEQQKVLHKILLKATEGN